MPHDADRWLWDAHTHTEMAYCASSVTAAGNVAGVMAAGLGGLTLTEHVWQLYTLRAEDAWTWRWYGDPDDLARRHVEGRARMQAYRDLIAPLRGDRVRCGLEMDVTADGAPTLAPTDRHGWDQLVGAVHFLGDDQSDVSEAEARRRFMHAVEALMHYGVDVLAHPFRWFAWQHRPAPTDLYDGVAALCARHGVAAEINAHADNPNDPDFFRRCLEKGARLSLGTDAHADWEIADFSKHRAVLDAVGLSEKDWPAALYRPAAL